MYKWDPEVGGFGLSPKRAENVISNQYLNSKKRGWESKQLKMR